MSTVAKQFFPFNNGLSFFNFFFYYYLYAPYLVFINFTSGEPLDNQIETGSAEEQLNNQWDADRNL